MSTTSDKKVILLYDGSCGLCHWAVNLSRKYAKDKKSIRYLPQESTGGLELITQHNIDLKVDSIYLIADDVVFYKSSAAFELVKRMKWQVKWLLGFSILPKFLMDIGYDFIAKHRKKIFGEVDSCEVN